MNDRLQPWIVTILAGPWPATFSVLPNAILQSQDRLMLLVPGPNDSYRLKIYVVCWCLLTLKTSPFEICLNPFEFFRLGQQLATQRHPAHIKATPSFKEREWKRASTRETASALQETHSISQLCISMPLKTWAIMSLVARVTCASFNFNPFSSIFNPRFSTLPPTYRTYSSSGSLADGQVEHSSYNSASSMFHHVPMFVKRPLNSCKASSCRQPVNQLNNSEALNYLWSYRLNQCPIAFYKLHIITPIQRHRIIHIHQIQSDTQWTESSL